MEPVQPRMDMGCEREKIRVYFFVAIALEVSVLAHFRSPNDAPSYGREFGCAWGRALAGRTRTSAVRLPREVLTFGVVLLV